MPLLSELLEPVSSQVSATSATPLTPLLIATPICAKCVGNDVFFENNEPIVVEPKDLHHVTDRRYNLSIVVIDDSYTHWDTIIGTAKNLLSDRVVILIQHVLAESQPQPDTNTLRALGFVIEKDIHIDTTRFRCASYNLAIYNRKRDWNNSRFWANPENFDKHRW